MNTNEKLNWANFIAVIHFLISFYTDHFFFEPVSKLNFGYWLFAKIIYFFFLQLGWMFIDRVMKRPKWRRILMNSIPFLVTMIVGIICIYPQLQYNGDIPYFFRNVVGYYYTGSLHWLSSIFYIVALMLIPAEGGPTILMGLCSAFTVGYIITLFESLTKHKWLLRIVFFATPFLFFSLFANRLPMVALAMLLYFAILFHDYMAGVQYSKWHVTGMLIFSGVLSVWRIECLTLLIFSPVLLILAQREKVKFKQYVIYFLVILFIHAAFGLPDKIAHNTTSLVTKLYPFVNYTLPTMGLSGLDLRQYPKEYEVIDGYLDVQALNEKIEREWDAFWKAAIIDVDVIRENGTTSITEYEKSVFRIIAKNPGIYLKSRLRAFQHICSNSFGVSGYYVDKNGNVSVARIIWLELFGGQAIPIGEGDTNGVLLVKQICNLIKKAMYNYWWIWTVFVVAFICAIKQKNIFLLACMLEMLAYSTITFLMSPAALFKYYWPVYVFVLLIIGSGILSKQMSEKD